MRAITTLALLVMLLFAGTDDATAQDRPASPRGEAATQVGDHWIVVDYGRPILRGRTNIFGEGESYGQAINAGAPVWRAGANQTTTLTTDAMLHFGDKMVPAGTYTMFVDLSADGWTLIISNHKGKANYRDSGDGLWGAYNYTDDKDVVRVKMETAEHPVSFDQFTIAFVDMKGDTGKIAMMWENTMATAEFMVMK